MADYFTKHHAPLHHQNIRPVYFYDKNSKLALGTLCEGVLNTGAPDRPYTRLTLAPQDSEHARLAVGTQGDIALIQTATQSPIACILQQ